MATAHDNQHCIVLIPDVLLLCSANIILLYDRLVPAVLSCSSLLHASCCKYCCSAFPWPSPAWPPLTALLALWGP